MILIIGKFTLIISTTCKYVATFTVSTIVLELPLVVVSFLIYDTGESVKITILEKAFLYLPVLEAFATEALTLSIFVDLSVIVDLLAVNRFSKVFFLYDYEVFVEIRACQKFSDIKFGQTVPFAQSIWANAFRRGLENGP